MPVRSNPSDPRAWAQLSLILNSLPSGGHLVEFAKALRREQEADKLTIRSLEHRIMVLEGRLASSEMHREGLEFRHGGFSDEAVNK